MKKYFLVLLALAISTFTALANASAANAAVQGSVTWSNFSAGANASPVVVTFEWPGATTEEIDLSFTGVRFNPAGFASSQSNPISSSQCTLVGVTNGTISVASSGTALAGNCGGQNPGLGNPNAQFGITDPTIDGNVITITFAAGSLEVTDASQASLEIDGIDSGAQSSSTVIDLSALAPTPAPLPDTGTSGYPEGALFAVALLIAGASISLFLVRKSS